MNKDIKQVHSIQEVEEHINSKGTLHTAKFALKQRKKVFIGNINGDLDINDIIKELSKDD